jgi:hypothetical protein
MVTGQLVFKSRRDIMWKKYRLAWILGLAAFLITPFLELTPSSPTTHSLASGLVEALLVGAIWAAIGAVIQIVLRRLSH